MDSPTPQLTTISAWSFSRLVEDYEACPYKAYQLYIVKRPKPPRDDVESEQRRLRGIAVHEASENYIRGITADLIPELATRADKFNEYRAYFEEGKAVVEQEWAFTRDWEPTGWFDKDCWHRAKLDVFVNLGNVGIVDDVKTGKKFGNEIKHAQQGQLYGIDVFMRYPDIDKIKVRFTYVDQPPKQDTERVYDRATLMRLLPTWNKRALKMTTATEFPAKPSKIACRFCPYGPNNGGDNSCPVGVEV